MVTKMLPFNSGIKAWEFFFFFFPLQVAEGTLEILSFNRWIFHTGKTESIELLWTKTPGQKLLEE